MMISIVVTRDDGSTITIGTNTKVDAPHAGVDKFGARLWNMHPQFNAIRSLTQEEAWAASFLCAQMGLRHLPVCAGNLAHLKAAAVYNEPTDQERGAAEEAGRIDARCRHKPNKPLEPCQGELVTSHQGDCQVAVTGE